MHATTSRPLILVLGLLPAVAACDASDLPRPADAVTARATSPRNAVVRWAPQDGEIRIERSTAGGPFEPAATRPARNGRFLDLGLSPLGRYAYRLTACRGDACADPVQSSAVRTPPSHLPDIEAAAALPDSGVDAALFTVATLDAALTANDPTLRQGSAILAAVDRSGTILWEYADPDGGLPWQAEPAPGGRLVALVGKTPLLMDLDGTVLGRRDGIWAHHDARALPDGRILYLFKDPFDVGAAMPVLGEGIAVADPETGTDDWVWLARNTFAPPTAEDVEDHPDPNPLATPGWEWLHANSVFFDAAEPAIYVNFLLTRRFCKIAYPAGTLQWCFGEGSPLQAVPPPAFAFGEGIVGDLHDTTPLPAEGRLLAYENRPPDADPEQESRAVLLDLDPAARSASIAHEYRDTEPFQSPFGGSARLLQGGSVLQTDPLGGRVFEVTGDGRKVFELRIAPHEGGWITYRAVAVDRSFFESW